MWQEKVVEVSPSVSNKLMLLKKKILCERVGPSRFQRYWMMQRILGILSMSLYDTKSLYLIIVACEGIKWIKKDCKLFYETQQKMVAAPFYQVNVIDDYNHFMGNIDITDQMRGSYCFDHWMLKRKWWWSMFFGSFKLLLTNSYILD